MFGLEPSHRCDHQIALRGQQNERRRDAQAGRDIGQLNRRTGERLEHHRLAKCDLNLTVNRNLQRTLRGHDRDHLGRQVVHCGESGGRADRRRPQCRVGDTCGDRKAVGSEAVERGRRGQHSRGSTVDPAIADRDSGTGIDFTQSDLVLVGRILEHRLVEAHRRHRICRHIQRAGQGLDPDNERILVVQNQRAQIDDVAGPHNRPEDRQLTGPVRLLEVNAEVTRGN